MMLRVHVPHLRARPWLLPSNPDSTALLSNPDSTALLSNPDSTALLTRHCLVPDVQGLLVSLVLKKLDNMKKVLSSGCTMILTVVLSHFAFGKEPHLNFYLAMVLIINAIVLYNLPAAAAAAAAAGAAPSSGTPSRSPPLRGNERRHQLLQSSGSEDGDGIF